MSEISDTDLAKLLQSVVANAKSTNEETKKEIKKIQPKKANLDGLPSWFKLSKFGEQIAGELEGYIEESDPTLLIGGTGMGKTVILEMIAKKLKRDSVGFNCYTGMDIAQLIGIWRPTASGEITWQDGVLSEGIRNGAIIRIEEYTRANPELKSRLFGILDSRNRSWNLFENGTKDIHVPKQTVIVASANPTGNGYTGTMREDKASMSRFAGVLRIDEPLADERHALMDTLENEKLVDRIMNFADACRKDKNTYLSTRDLHFFAKAIKRGIDPKRVCETVLMPKYEGNDSAILTQARAYFEEYDVKDLDSVVEESV